MMMRAAVPSVSCILRNADIATVNLFLEYKADIMQMDLRGVTMLHFAALNKEDPAVVRFILGSKSTITATYLVARLCTMGESTVLSRFHTSIG